ncbi:hypothetical protein HELRODRAFT_170125 [Helobdella robusta]|uniref:NADAR domain-containing protein n=1 Tax=Helobdella robusta TaxID=6412 RepID=T1F2P1_HELRO|nr:hypothetical protein HELRODRAFT_170125 [Helobdella robusta]ESO07579.1 hypothetical protein HELRODRAFT_170125 [Helobdella robusta]
MSSKVLCFPCDEFSYDVTKEGYPFTIDNKRFWGYRQYLYYFKTTNNHDLREKIYNAKNLADLHKLDSLLSYNAKTDDEMVLEYVIMAQFRQNEKIRSELLKTGTATLGYLHGKNLFLGIGFRELQNPQARSEANWKGKNFLGKILMKASICFSIFPTFK